jgi:hypothetical protein
MASHPGLTTEDVLARGGWHLGYARVLAVASDGDCGFAVVDGNGDGAELETEIWAWDGGTWINDSSSGAGPSSRPAPIPALPDSLTRRVNENMGRRMNCQARTGKATE